MSISKTLFPPSNREAALVAFLRTFWQVVRATSILGGGGAIVVSAADLQHIHLITLAYIAGAVMLSATLSGLFAAGNILVNGLPAAYSNAAIASIPAAAVSSVAIPAPADPAQPAAGVPPAGVDGIASPAL